jgi:hypothetical protein
MGKVQKPSQIDGDYSLAPRTTNTLLRHSISLVVCQRVTNAGVDDGTSDLAPNCALALRIRTTESQVRNCRGTLGRVPGPQNYFIRLLERSKVQFPASAGQDSRAA